MSAEEPQKSQLREEKRARFSQPGGRSGAKKLTVFVGFALAALVTFVAFRDSSSSEPVTAAVVQPAQPTPTGNGSQSLPEQKNAGNTLADANRGAVTRPDRGTVADPNRGAIADPNRGTASDSAENEIAVPLADLKDGHAKFFKYTAADKTEMRFFAIRSSDGVYRAALDACDVCYRAKKGYEQDGDDMVCRKCGQRFHSALVNEVTGGCNPVALARNVVGDKLIIKTSELESRKAFF